MSEINIRSVASFDASAPIGKTLKVDYEAGQDSIRLTELSEKTGVPFGEVIITLNDLPTFLEVMISFYEKLQDLFELPGLPPVRLPVVKTAKPKRRAPRRPRGK